MSSKSSIGWLGAMLSVLVGCAPAEAPDVVDGASVMDAEADASVEDVIARDDVTALSDALDSTTCEDRDRDGHRALRCGGDDCDDDNANRAPGLAETCDGLDNDCDGAADVGECVDSRAATTGYGTCSATRECVLRRCVAGRADCDSVSGNGCETQTTTNVMNCGACGVRCRFGACVAGRCEDQVEQLAAAGSAMCARYRSGNVACWGTSPAFGDGSQDVTQRNPVSVAGISDAVELRGGHGFLCVRRASGAVACWGRNDLGQLGDGSATMFRATPRPVMGIVDAVQISAGDNGACAVLSGGGVRCWGSNNFGESAADPMVTSVRVPVEVSGVRDAVDVARGMTHACVRLRSGTLECWGRNSSGQLGDGTLGGSRSLPVTVGGLSDAVEIMVAWDHSCARRRTGEVLCWGSNANGAIGDGTRFTNIPTPTEVAGLTDLAQVVGGVSFTCARGSAGAVFCWGFNNRGQVGADVGDEQVLVPNAVREVSDAVEIVAGAAWVCARLRSGSVRCWGDNAYGQHGYGFTGETRPTPTTVFDLTDATQVSAKGFHVCARRATGEVSCWGANSVGAVGDERVGRTFARPNPVRDLRDVQEVRVGGAHTCARLTSGQVLCWGDNLYRQLGTTELLQRTSTPRLVEGVSNIVELAAGLRHTCARDTLGAVWCWGRDDLGQLGDGTPTNSLGELPTRVVGLSDAVQIVAGNDFNCARRRSGAVYCWGEATFGGLGDGVSVRSATPVAVDGLSDAVLVTAGIGHACAQRSGGEVLCWGSNLHGQLGDGSMASVQLSPVSVVGERSLLGISAGAMHTCALRSDNTVACWGNNTQGATGTIPLAATVPLPTPVALARDVTSVSSGNGFTCALRRDSTVACWGNNGFAQLGIGRVSPPVEL